MEITAAIARAPSKLSIEKVQIEDPRPDEVLVRMVATGLCHTDVSALEGILPMEMPMVAMREGSTSGRLSM